ncbi:Plasmodium yoelii subtelomeric region (PYST-C1), putative [Plasmodium chabaudi adami]|uniref:Plasmodium yoelii subtelomeric region (PYST-C1), putative n=1 Tax=Plasmodium chabaudi adami TaxID=5826 RepID=A0A1C6WDV2_PLACE|nr:Plasmodium yoelii subtelomeric region (PYST-C1), putative [Plasmodium chabaudi adami]
MNKRIFSLVCIVLYALLAVSIHCSEEKHDRSKGSGLRSRISRVIKQIRRSNKKNDIESKREIQSNNNNNYDCENYYGAYEDQARLNSCWCCIYCDKNMPKKIN